MAGPARVRSTLPFFLFERRVVWYRRRFNGALNANSVCLCLTNVNLGDEGVAALVVGPPRGWVHYWEDDWL